MRQATVLYEEGASFALAIYVGGVAVECLLRAFKGRRDPTFDDKHNLLRLFASSGMLRVDRGKLRTIGWSEEEIDRHLRALQAAANEIFPVWANNYRYASEERLRSHLKRVTGYRKIKGDYLKELTRAFLNSVQRFLDKGVVLWRI
jgi:hypothetical protein